MKETLKRWFSKWWEIDYKELDDPDGYSCPSWIVFKTFVLVGIFVFVFVAEKNYQVEINWVDILGSAFMCLYIAIFVYGYIQINKSIKERRVFTERNARLFVRMGNALSGTSMLMIPVLGMVDSFIIVLLAFFPLLVSMCFQTIGWMIHKGIQMQEEQDLTI